MRQVYLLSSLLLLFFSCQKFEQNNPFDSKCPKEIWTPTSFIAVQNGTSVTLSWSQPMNNISGFKITKKVDMGSATDLQSQTKEISQFADAALTGGKLHTYTIVAYAGNNQSNILTAQVTPLFLSTLSSTTISIVKAYSATLISAISSDGGAPLTAKGICWSTSQNPTISNSKTNEGSGSVAFTSNLPGLSSSTTYYARSYATSSVGTAYGTQISFTTNYGEVTDADGNIYQTIKIGTQIWTRENLKTTKYKDGIAIPLVTDNTAWSALTTPGYCWFNNDATTNKNVYGALYNWHTVNTNKLCPTGWHVPTDVEWTTLTTYLGGETVAGGKLKETGTTHWLSPNNGATNESGFTAVPSGSRSYNVGTFSTIGSYGYWWSSSDVNTDPAWNRGMYYDIRDVGRNIASKQNGFSVRCITGDLTPPTLTTASTTSLTTTTAASGGSITSDGGTAVTARGVCWSTTTAPTIANNKTSDGTGSGTFASPITGLTAGTTYYVRAYATNSAGTAYGNEVNFKTNSVISGTVNDIDGNIYSTVAIGTQVWMASNLKTTKYNDGTSIINISDGTKWSATKPNTSVQPLISAGAGSYSLATLQGAGYISGAQRTSIEQELVNNGYTLIQIGSLNITQINIIFSGGAYCWYNNDEITNKSTYGALYNWYTVNTGKLCPTGRHMPSDSEWTTLTTYLGGEGVAGGKLKETGTSHWTTPNTGTTNTSGFTAVPGGYRYPDGSFYDIGNYGYWWSSTEYSPTIAWNRYLYYNFIFVTRGVNGDKQNGSSVRCVRD